MISPVFDAPLLLVEGEERVLVAADLHLGLEYELRLGGVSIPSQTKQKPTTNANAVMATGMPILPYQEIPAPTRKVAPAATNRPIPIAKAIELPLLSVGYCSGNHAK